MQENIINFANLWICRNSILQNVMLFILAFTQLLIFQMGHIQSETSIAKLRPHSILKFAKVSCCKPSDVANLRNISVAKFSCFRVWELADLDDYTSY